MGTVYGAVIGSVLFIVAQNYLQATAESAGAALSKAYRC